MLRNHHHQHQKGLCKHKGRTRLKYQCKKEGGDDEEKYLQEKFICLSHSYFFFSPLLIQTRIMPASTGEEIKVYVHEVEEKEGDG